MVAHFQQNFAQRTLADCERFISASMQEQDSLHLAITDEEDIYMGTVSLKRIDPQQRDAEFAIVLHPYAMGKGYAQFAMKQILILGFEELGLKRIFWCVSPENGRAVRFYDKGCYCRVNADAVKAERYYDIAQARKLFWYQKEA